MKKVTAILLTVMLLVSVCTTAVSAQSTVTSISFSNASAVAEENLSISGYGDKDSGYAASTTGGRLYASVSGTDLRKLEWSKGEYGDQGMQPAMTGGTKNPWGNGAYLEVRVSTEGYKDITFSASIGATNKGPRDYKLQYSTDGVNFKDVSGASFTVTQNKTLFEAFDNVQLPAAADDASTLYVRITVASNMMVNGTAGLIGSTGGETAINHIVVNGTPISATATTAADADEETATNADAATTAAEADASSTVAATTATTAVSSADTADATKAPTALLLMTAVGVLCAAMIPTVKRKRT